MRDRYVARFFINGKTNAQRIGMLKQNFVRVAKYLRGLCEDKEGVIPDLLTDLGDFFDLAIWGLEEEAAKERKRAEDAEQEAAKAADTKRLSQERAALVEALTEEVERERKRADAAEQDADALQHEAEVLLMKVDLLRAAGRARDENEAREEEERNENRVRGEKERDRVRNELDHAHEKIRGMKEKLDRLTANLAVQAQVRSEKKRDSVTSADVGVNTDEVVELIVAVRPEPMEGVIGVADSEVPVVPTVSRHRRQSSSAEHRQGSVSPRSHRNGGERAGVMAKAVVVHGINTNWKVSGVADCVEGIMGRVIGARWLLGAGRRVGKTASSMVVYLNKEVFLGPKAYIRMVGVEHSVIPYCWRV